MKIRINLATRPFADVGPTLKRLQIAMAVFALVAIGLGVGLHLLHSKAEAARAREHSLDDQIGKINHERQGYQAMMREPDNALVLDESGNLNTLFDQKAFSWTLAMEDLETVLPGGVQVTALEPIRDEKTARITLKLRVVGPHDKDLQLVGNLEHSRHFLRPTIVGESTETSGGPGQPLEPVSATNKVNFDLTAEYNPATLGEDRQTKKAEDSGKSEPRSSGTEAAPHKHAVPAKGPGLRRPPSAGVSNPPPVAQPNPPATAGQHRFPQTQPGANPQQTPKPRPGGLQ